MAHNLDHMSWLNVALVCVLYVKDEKYGKNLKHVNSLVRYNDVFFQFLLMVTQQTKLQAHTASLKVLCLQYLHNNIASRLYSVKHSLKAVPEPQRVSELNCKKSGFVFVQTILPNISINLMSEYAVALGHYTIPFEIK